MSEIVDFVVSGRNEKIYASLMCGRRESNYKSDGESSELIPYGIITLVLLDEVSVDSVKYCLYVGVNKHQGDMKKNPYDDSWAVDIKKVFDKSENISLDIFCDENKYSIKLNVIDQDWVVNAGYVINNILIKENKKNLKSLVSDGEFEGEVFVKLICEYDIYSSVYYYYVSVIGKNGSSFSLLINPKTADVLARNSID
jgi:hypothetical protein